MSSLRGGFMTFEEIGARLGISAALAFVIYKAAIRKMRRRWGLEPDDLAEIAAAVRGGKQA